MTGRRGLPGVTRVAIVGLLLAPPWTLGCNRGANGGGQVQAEDAARAPIPVRTAVAASRTLPSTLDLDGTLLADQQSNVTGIVPGRVVAVMVERGDEVQEGQPLVRLRDADYRLQQAAARAALAQAQARLGLAGGGQRVVPEEVAEVRAARANRDLAEETLRRTEQLARLGAASQADLDRASAAATAAREQYNSAVHGAQGANAALASARVALRQAQSAVRDSVVRAPFAGEIAERHVEVGEFVAPQMPVVTLVRADPLRLELSVPQERIGAVQVGQHVTVRVDAFPDRVFEATVRYISAAVRRDTRGLSVEATLPNPDRVLRPGLFARARLDLGAPRAVVSVPPAAVLSEAGSHRAFVVAAGRIEERVIRIVDRQQDAVLVADGLRPGERVAVEHLERLSDGQRAEAR